MLTKKHVLRTVEVVLQKNDCAVLGSGVQASVGGGMFSPSEF